MDARFCPRCGHALELRVVADRERPTCPRCGYVHYVNPVVAAGTLVEREGRVLLVCRGVQPGLGQWGLPAGYAEAGELPEDTAVRETREETGLDVAIDDFLGVFGFLRPAPPGGVLVLYAAHIVGGEPVPGADEREVRFFAPGELAGLPIAFALHRRALGRWARAATIAIEPAQADHLPAIAAMAPGDVLPAEGPPLEEYVADARGLLLVALEGREPVGFLAAWPDAEVGALALTELLVRPEYRRWGIGSRLVERAAELGAGLGYARLVADVATDNVVLLLLQRIGFGVERLVPGRGAARLRLARALERAASGA